MTLTLNYKESGVASDHFNLPFSDFVTDWQYAAAAITPKTADTTTNKKTQEYHFSYDSFGNMIGVAAGGYKLAEYLYNAGNGILKQMNYGTGGSLGRINYTYDDLDRVVQAVYY